MVELLKFYKNIDLFYGLLYSKNVAQLSAGVAHPSAGVAHCSAGTALASEDTA